MNAKAKGTRAELRCIKTLEAVGYLCTRAGASLGAFDVIGLHPTVGVARFIQVKSGTSRLSKKDRLELVSLAPLTNTIFVEYWHWDRKWTTQARVNPYTKSWIPCSSDS
jgi:succinyl-CoA synthetase beta subunit